MERRSELWSCPLVLGVALDPSCQDEGLRFHTSLVLISLFGQVFCKLRSVSLLFTQGLRIDKENWETGAFSVFSFCPCMQQIGFFSIFNCLMLQSV